MGKPNLDDLVELACAVFEAFANFGEAIAV
jgi:hypothetical protein